MSQEREAIVLGTTPGKSEAQIKEEVEALTYEQKRAKYLHILERGVIIDRSKVELPDHLYGEWVRNDDLSIKEMEALGFQIDSTYATKSNRANIHSDGTSKAVMGDVVFMTLLKEDKEIISSVRAEISASRNAKPNNVKIAKEEKEFEQMTHYATQGEIQTFTDSSLRTADAEEIKATQALAQQMRRQ